MVRAYGWNLHLQSVSQDNEVTKNPHVSTSSFSDFTCVYMSNGYVSC